MDKAKLPALAQPPCPRTSSAPPGRRAAGFLWCDVLPREPGWQQVGPGHPSVSVLGFKVLGLLDMTKVRLDDEHLLAPHEEHVPPWEDEEFPSEEAAPCHQKRWERVAWPCRHGIQVSSLSPRSALPFCVDELEPPSCEPCLPVPGGCLPFLPAHGIACHCPQPGKASPLQAPSRTATLSGTPCSVSCSGLAAGTPGMGTRHSLDPAPRNFVPSGLSPLGDRGSLVAGGWGQRGGQETP